MTSEDQARKTRIGKIIGLCFLTALVALKVLPQVDRANRREGRSRIPATADQLAGPMPFSPARLAELRARAELLKARASLREFTPDPPELPVEVEPGDTAP